MRPLTLSGRQATFSYVVCIAHLGQVSLSIAFLGKKKKYKKPRTTEVRRGATHTKATLLARIQAVSRFFGLILTL
ncbi:hypothetical protein QG37_02055 [Candidozyma auris]|nr:hypothetical protein QG37_02055 [[Candida] auris]